MLRWVEAAAHARRATELQPTLVAAHVLLVQSLRMAGDLKAALAAVREAYRLDTSHAPQPAEAAHLKHEHFISDHQRRALDIWICNTQYAGRRKASIRNTNTRYAVRRLRSPPPTAGYAIRVRSTQGVHTQAVCPARQDAIRSTQYAEHPQAALSTARQDVIRSTVEDLT